LACNIRAISLATLGFSAIQTFTYLISFSIPKIRKIAEDSNATGKTEMKTNFVDKGYPVILGEFGVSRCSPLTGNTLGHHSCSNSMQ
jgi:hypothetical protein